DISPNHLSCTISSLSAPLRLYRSHLRTGPPQTVPPSSPIDSDSLARLPRRLYISLPPRPSAPIAHGGPADRPACSPSAALYLTPGFRIRSLRRSPRLSFLLDRSC